MLVLTLIAPIAFILITPGVATSIQRISALSGEVLFFSILGSLGLTIVYLVYRLIYVSESHQSFIEYSATTLLIHLLAQSVLTFSLVGGLTTFKIIPYSSVGTLAGIVTLVSTLVHISLDSSLYFSRGNATLSKADDQTRRQNIPALVGSIATSAFIVLLVGISIPEQIGSFVLISLILFWEIFYLLVILPTLSHQLTR